MTDQSCIIVKLRNKECLRFIFAGHLTAKSAFSEIINGNEIFRRIADDSLMGNSAKQILDFDYLDEFLASGKMDSLMKIDLLENNDSFDDDELNLHWNELAEIDLIEKTVSFVDYFKEEDFEEIKNNLLDDLESSKDFSSLKIPVISQKELFFNEDSLFSYVGKLEMLEKSNDYFLIVDPFSFIGSEFLKNPPFVEEVINKLISGDLSEEKDGIFFASISDNQ